MTIGNEGLTDAGQMFTEITDEAAGNLHKVVLDFRSVPRVVATFERRVIDQDGALALAPLKKMSLCTAQFQAC